MSATCVSASHKPDPYQQVTDLIISHLETGVVPWRCPWNREIGRPRNFYSGKPYQGVNVILLGCRFRSSPWWMTFRQSLERGGHVRKGEKGSLVVKYGTFEKTEEETESAFSIVNRKSGMYLKTFTVFNAMQIGGIAFPEVGARPMLLEKTRLERAEAIIRGMETPPRLIEGEDRRAFYRPQMDTVHMPAFSHFESAEAYYSTLYHEFVHATGHPSRLGRASLTKHDEFGGQVYSQEELVAEMGAAFLGLEADIVRDQHEQSAAYLSGWLGALRVQDHRRWIVQAASQATRAADFILGRLTKNQ